jgi:hypothetical protein
MPVISEIPRLFFFLDRTYSYPTLQWAELEGREVHVEKMFLHSGATVSGKYILRVIASAIHGRVDLLAEAPSSNSSWVMLTQDEAQLIIATLQPHPAPSEAIVMALHPILLK